MASLEERMAQLEQVLSAAAAPATQAQATEYQTVNALFQGQGASPLTARPTGMAGAALGLGEQAISQAFQPFVNYQTAANGAIKYQDTGVIADPVNQVVLFPTHKSDVDDIEGSEEWLRKIQKTWSEDKFNKWRKRLIELGYDQVVGGIAEKGGAAMDVIAGLREYHKSRYLNGGEALPLFPTDGKPDSIRKQVDFKVLKENVGTWLDAVGFERDDDAQDFFAQQVIKTANRLTKKGWTPDQALAGAEVRVKEDFAEAPGVKGELNQMEDDEMDESLRNDAISIMQLGVF